MCPQVCQGRKRLPTSGGGETAANFGRRASRQGAGWEDKGGGGVAGGRVKWVKVSRGKTSSYEIIVPGCVRYIMVTSQ